MKPPLPGRPFRRNAFILAALITVAAMLAWRLPGDVVARSLFQSSPIMTDTPVPTATLEPSPTPSPTAAEAPLATDTPVPTVPPLATVPVESSPTPSLLASPEPTSEIVPSAMPDESTTPVPSEEQPVAPAEASSVAAGATPPGFLPPPTLTSPGGPGLAPSLLPQPGPPLAAPPAPPPEPASQPESAHNEVPSAAQLIDNALLALSYGWLCCGVLALIIAVIAFVWLARRSKSYTQPSTAESERPDHTMS